MFSAFRQVQAKPRSSGSLQRERHLPGELRPTFLRPAPRRGTAARALLSVAIELLCIGAIPALWYLSASPTVPPPEIIAAQSGSTSETPPQALVGVQEPERGEPLLVPKPIGSEGDLAESERPAAVPTSIELFAKTGVAAEPLYTGSISLSLSRTAEQTTRSQPAAGPPPVPLTTEESAEGQLPNIEAPRSGDLVDLNTAGPEALNRLGVGLVGRQVVANRPYDHPEDLVTKRVLTRKDFDLIRAKVTAR